MDVGTHLGEFILREKLGEGSYGVVYRAEQPSLMRDAVVKILRGHHADDALARQRFLREARLASRLDHPCAAHIYQFGSEDDGALWIAMELVRGTPLSHFLRNEGALPLAEVVLLLEQIADVVASAHEQGIIHRDLKPANIMVVERGGRLIPKLLDFGLARHVAAAADTLPSSIRGSDPAATQAGAVLGSPYYMSPEQWEGEADAASDQYALGVVAFECLTGNVPFKGTLLQVAGAHARAAVPPLGSGLPETVHAVIARAMAKRQGDRYDSVVAFAAALREAAGLPQETPLPAIGPVLRSAAAAPQPIAETVAAIEAARDLGEALEAVEIAEATLCRWVAVLALAAFSRTGRAPDAALAAKLHRLREQAPDAAEWLELASDLVAPFADRPSEHPMPELVARVAGVRLQRRESSDPAASAKLLSRRIEALASLYGQLAFVADHPVVVAHDGVAESWMGPRRVKRQALAVIGRALPDQRPAVLDTSGRPLLVLWPLAQAVAPSPAAPQELFLLAGGRATRLEAPPLGFEHQDDGVWDWLRRQLDLEPDAVGSAAYETTPFLGLRAYGPEDAARFVGREELVQGAINRLRVSSLLVIAGPSGSGKSSFLQAGVIPALGSEWATVCFRPGPDPLSTLRARLAGESPGRGPLLLAVDQLEEIFTLCPDPEARHEFATTLVAAAQGRLRVIATVRDDFLARLQQLSAFRDRLAANLQLLATPAEPELLRILTEPVRRGGYAFDDPQLPREMVRAVAEQPAALALLSFTAGRLWEHRDRHFRQLTRRAYEEMGGVGGALARHAESMLAELVPEEQRLVREAFRHLVTWEGTRAVLARAELISILGGGPAAERVLEKLLEARLCTTTDEDRLEIVHEALIVAWPRLGDWRREDADDARFRGQLRTAAQTWDERGRPKALLWRAEALGSARGGLTATEDAFVRASRRDAARGRRVRIGLVTAAFVGLVVVAVVLLRFARSAEDRLLESYVEQGRQHMLAGETVRGLAFLTHALSEGAEGPGLRYLVARGAERVALAEHVFAMGDIVSSVALTPDGVVATTRQGSVGRWELPSGRRAVDQRTRSGTKWSGRLSPDHGILGLAGSDDRATLVRIEDGVELANFTHAGVVNRVAFSRDGTQVATADLEGTIKRWRLADGSLLGTMTHGSRVFGLEFLGEDLISSGDDGRVTCWTAAGVARWTHRVVAGPLVGLRVEAKTKQIAIAGGSTVHLLDAADGRILLALEHLRPVNSVRFAERGGRVVTAGSDGFVRVWKLESGALELLLSGHRGEATAAAFCGADGAHVASGGADGTARVWETANGRSLGALEGHGDRVSYLECDSTRVVTGSVDGTVRVWTSREPQVVSRIIPGTRAISMLDVSSDDERILVSEYGVRASVWDRQGRRRYAIEAPVATATFSPDGRQIVTAEGARGVARLWDADRQVEIATFHGSPDVNYAELSPTGDLLVTSSAAGTPELWRADSGSLVLRLTGHERQVLTATFRPDGKRVATASQDNTARVWSLDGREHATLRGHSSYVLSAFFDPSGQRLVTGGSDQTVRVWDAETGRPLQTMAGHTGEVAAAAYSKDGALIASASADRTARVWEARTGRLLQVLSGHTGRVSFVTFSRDGHLFTAGEEDGIVLEWDVGRFSGSAAEVTQALGCRQPFDLRDGKVVRRPGCE